MRGKLATRTRQDIGREYLATTPRAIRRSPRPPTWKPRTTRAAMYHRPRALSHRRVLARRQAAARRIRDRRSPHHPSRGHSAARRTHSSIRSASWKRRSCACRLRWPWIPSPATLARPPAFQVRRAQHGAGAEHPATGSRCSTTRWRQKRWRGTCRSSPTSADAPATFCTETTSCTTTCHWFKTGGGVVSLVLMGAGFLVGLCWARGPPGAPRGGAGSRAGASLPGARAPRPRSARLRWQTSRRESRDCLCVRGDVSARGRRAGPTRQGTTSVDGPAIVECRDAAAKVPVLRRR